MSDDYDPFPKSGLVKQYEPFIRKYVGGFCQKYPRVGFLEGLIEAVRLAVLAEVRFKPERGHDFSTFLRHHLKGLYRELVGRHEKHERRPLSAAEKMSLKIEKEQERGEPTRPVNFAGGGNGARLTFDLQWVERDTASPMTNSYNGNEREAEALKARHRVLLGIQLQGVDALGLSERLSPDLSFFLDNQTPGPTLSGRMRAVIYDGIRCQREVEREAENQKHGNFDPVFLAVDRSSAIDVAFYKGRLPPRFRPPPPPTVGFDEACGRDDDDGTPLKWSDVLAPGTPPVERESSLLPAAAKARHSLTGKERDCLDWMLNPQGRNLTHFAADIGMTKGGASKMRERVLREIGRHLPDEK